MAGLALVAFITYYAGFRILADVTQNALFRLRQDLFEHTQELSLTVL